MKRTLTLLAPVVLLLALAVSGMAQEIIPRTCTVTASTYTDKLICDVYEANATSNAITITLVSPAKRRTVAVVKTDSSNNAVTIATAGTGTTLDGNSSITLRQQNEAITLFSNGKSGSSGVWRSTGQKDKPIHYAEIAIASADITGTSAGQLGHANGYPLVAAPGTHNVIELISAVVVYQFSVAAYTGGGNISVNYAGGGAALSATVSYANSVGAAANKIALLIPVTPTNNQLAENTGLNLVAAAAPTQPGTAAGVIRVKVAYRIHASGL